MGRESDYLPPGVFATTHWSVVLAAGAADSEAACLAAETLCSTYWYPIYVYVRRKGYGPEDAQDLTQEFFCLILAKNHFQLADRTKGRFRTFLLSVLDYFVAREWSRAHRQKRGGQFSFFSLDQLTPEERYRLEPAETNTPESMFLRQWALTVLKQTMAALERESAESGKEALFREVRHLLAGERDGDNYATIGGRLGMSEGAVRVAVHRSRRRYGELLREQVAMTLQDTSEVDEELSFLMEALRR